MRHVVLLSALVVFAGACGRVGGSPTPLPTVVLDIGGAPGDPTAVGRGQVTASGIVSSPQEADLAFGQGGIVQTVHVAVGDSVRAGDVLVELESTQAQLNLDHAQRVLRELTSGGAIAAADQAVALAQQEQDKAQKKVVALSYPRATEAFIDNLKAQITLARRELAEATREFNHVEDRADNDPQKARAQVRMTDAQINLNKLLGNYNWYTGQPSEIDVDLAYANLEAANAAVQEAQWYASALRGDPVSAEASGANLAALQGARDAVGVAQAQLDATRLEAPFDGIVGAVLVHPGEYASPGQVALVVTDLNHLQVETTDLSELDLTELQVGDSATIDIEALGEQTVGHIVAISPVPELLGGDVVYRVFVDLDEVPSGLRPGMTTVVTFSGTP
jgi:multidrug efflux pump subunit AcrA (membrane-fusion protein)